MIKRLRALIPARKARGQSLVELAISLMVMLLLLAGAVTFGMALFSYVAIRDAAQEGALYGSFNPFLDSAPTGFNPGEEANVNGAVICARVKAASTSPVNMNSFGCSTDGATYHAGNNIDVYATYPSHACEGTDAGGTPNGIQVRVEYNYQIVMPFFGAVTGGSNQIHLNAVVTDTILEPKCP